MKKIIGIDYGSKLAGTTVICYAEGDELNVKQSAKKKDADAFIKSFCNEHQPDCVYIDAPLSLPLVYSSAGKGLDYFYRQADKATQAMSPMFLGGLTARAIKLKDESSASIFYEAYPKMLVDTLDLKSHYKADISLFLQSLATTLPSVSFPKTLGNWHQVDALLAYLSGYRHQQGEALVYGDADEGLIYV